MISTPQHNQQVATIFRSMAERLASQRANPYRVRAYRRAALPVLERRLANGELALHEALDELRTRIVTIDPAELANINTLDDLARL